MKTIGVLGGIGPQATMDFEARVHAEAQRVLPPKYNEGYPPLVSVYLRHAPVIVRDGRPVRPLELDERVLTAAARLGSWADVIAIPSNTPHLFLDAIAREAGRPVLSIVDVTMAEIRRRQVDRVGLLGLGIPQVYEERLDRDGIAYEVASEDAREDLDAAILRLMEGRDGEAERAAASRALTEVRGRDVPATVLGCTEIPLLLGDAADADDLINPNALLAREAVRVALED